jgi:methylmalonyl-CoA/ethylmalonyl-CoA epimerase
MLLRPKKISLKYNVMDTIATKTSFDLKFVQIAWVVKDIKVAEKFFKDTMGINLGKTVTIRERDFEATYYGKPSNAESLVSMAYSGGTFTELIQPLSGRSIFQDYLDKNPAGGVQHIAYSTPLANFDKVISELTDKGYPVVATYNTPIAKIVFFDTYKEIGVMTELMGITKEGEEQVQKMKH